MLIHKFDDRIELKKEEDEIFTKIDDVVNNVDFSMSDLRFVTTGDGWLYIVDYNTGKVATVNDYGYDVLDEFYKTGIGEFYYIDDEDVIEEAFLL